MQLSRTALRPWGALLVTALVTAVLVAVAPAAFAAPTLTLTASSPEIEVGDVITIEWAASDDADTLVASGNGWATDGAKPLTGSETFEATTPGTFTFTLIATDADDAANPTEETVTVEVAEPAVDVTVTPEPVTQEGCSITIPEVEGVDYVVDQVGDRVVLDPGTYPTYFLAQEDFVVTAEAQDGFTLSDGAATEFAVEVGEECQLSESELVTATPTCGAVTFQSLVDERIRVVYGAQPQYDDDALELAPGASQTISTDRVTLDYLVFDEDFSALANGVEAVGDPQFQTGSVFTLSTCPSEDDAGSGFPTTAPAAGH